jgi:pilus assembly protein Flp/PilA
LLLRFALFAGLQPWGDQKPLLEIVMNLLAKKVQRFLVSEDGPTAVEYAVMLALIIIVCLAAISTIGTRANQTFTDVGNSLNAGAGT